MPTHGVLVDLDDDNLQVMLVSPFPPQTGDTAVPDVVAQVHQPRVNAILAARRRLEENIDSARIYSLGNDIKKGSGEGDGLNAMHGRIRLTIDPRIPIMPGRSTTGFHRRDRHCLHQARGAVRCSASRIKGGLHAARNRSWGGLACIRMTSVELIRLFSAVATPRGRQGNTM